MPGQMATREVNPSLVTEAEVIRDREVFGKALEIPAFRPRFIDSFVETSFNRGSTLCLL